MIPIDKGVPIPEMQYRKSPYPIAEMKVGDSFYVPVKQKDLQKARNRLNAVLQRHKRDGWGFTMRTVEGGLRIWRTE